MTGLSVNISKIATLRNARSDDAPNVTPVARRCREFGVEGITVHPRPNERHITYQDMRDFRKVVTTEFNIEGYPSDSLLDPVCSVYPEQVTFTPNKLDTLTSDSGQAVVDCRNLLKPIVERLRQAGIRVSLSVGTDSRHIETAAEIGADRVKLCTEPYASRMAQSGDPKVIVAPLAGAARVTQRVGLGVNAGHDLNRDNLACFIQHVTLPDEASIGHALIDDTLYLGLKETIAQYLKQAYSSS